MFFWNSLVYAKSILLRFIFSDISITGSTVISLVFAWYIFINHFNFNLYLALGFRYMYYKKHIAEIWYFCLTWKYTSWFISLVHIFLKGEAYLSPDWSPAGWPLETKFELTYSFKALWRRVMACWLRKPFLVHNKVWTSSPDDMKRILQILLLYWYIALL